MTLNNLEIDTLVVGAGQAGVAMSEHLSKLGVPHLVLERNRIAQAWRTGRWDSLVANGPAWHDRFPGLEFNLDADAFAGKDQVADYFEQYVRKYNLPVRTGIEVKRVVRNSDRPPRGRRHRPVPEAGEPGHRAERQQPAPDPFRCLLQPRAVARRRCAGGRRRFLGRADRRRTDACRAPGVPLGRRPRSPTTRLPQPRLLLVAGRAG